MWLYRVFKDNDTDGEPYLVALGASFKEKQVRLLSVGHESNETISFLFKGVERRMRLTRSTFPDVNAEIRDSWAEQRKLIWGYVQRGENTNEIMPIRHLDFVEWKGACELSAKIENWFSHLNPEYPFGKSETALSPKPGRYLITF